MVDRFIIITVVVLVFRENAVKSEQSKVRGKFCKRNVM